MLLKNAKAVRVGSRAASAVSLGNTRVWPHKRIIGYTVYATSTLSQNPFGTSYETGSDGDTWMKVAGTEGLAAYFPRLDTYVRVSDMTSRNNGVEFTGDQKVDAKRGDEVRLCLPKWG